MTTRVASICNRTYGPEDEGWQIGLPGSREATGSAGAAKAAGNGDEAKWL